MGLWRKATPQLVAATFIQKHTLFRHMLNL
jgi:hypothetical protein